MDEYTLTEFAIFYKRLIQVELSLKNLIIEKYSNVYNDNAYNIIYRIYKKYSREKK